MTRAQVIGFAFIAAVAVAVALGLSLTGGESTTLKPIGPPPTATSTTTTTDDVTARAKAQAERIAQEQAKKQQEDPSSAAPAAPPRTKRQTREAEAQQLKKRLELVAEAIEEARKRPSGSLQKEQVKAGVTEVKPEIQDCYEQALAQNPKLGGTIKVLFEIGPDPDDDTRGAVVAGEVDSELGSPFFEACVLQQIVGADFPRPEGGGIVKVTYPFKFFTSEETVDAGSTP